ncbi:MAG: ATP-dependent Clp protease ATP-binding subunit, partial [Herpetosiphon sp.]|nr:ATP-dependent Clp protease ATP-binding subunit [Herpetosiphon sp.]
MSDHDSTPVPTTMQRAIRGDQNPLDKVEQEIRSTVFGQNRAIESLIRALNRARFGFSAGSTQRPRATLLFLGPTGVGKSEVAKRLASFLHPQGGGLLKIDCSLFSQGHEVSALLGAPPSYVGRDQKPLFDPDVIEQENSIVLFDEIEKATSELWNLLLQIMEDGEITLLNGGRKVSFQRTILIMTTNVGAHEMANFVSQRTIGFRTSSRVVESTGQQIYQIGFDALQKVFSPEWINRIDEIIAFRPLSSETLRQVLDRMVKESNEQYRNHGVEISLTENARDYILRRGFDPRFGARPLRSRLMKDIDAPLADLLASGGIPAGAKVLVDVSAEEGTDGNNLDFFFEP